ncbi:MAG: chemotaxis protein MotB [Kiritimatiellia bacterium]|jgi:chemotaxis protein MotB
MARKKKKKADGPPGVPPWMATFSDLVTLLLTFFVMLMAMASFEESQQLETVFESLRRALSSKGAGPGLLSMVEGNKLADLLREDTLVRPTEAADRKGMKADLSNAVPDLSPNEVEVRLHLDERAFFASGQSQLKPGARSHLRDVGLALRDQNVRIRVEGHTDAEGTEAENWRLSLLRALTVTDALHTDGGVPVTRLEARGMGPFSPIATYSPDQARNRRIELVLVGDDVPAREAMTELKQRLGQ